MDRPGPLLTVGAGPVLSHLADIFISHAPKTNFCADVGLPLIRRVHQKVGTLLELAQSGNGGNTYSTIPLRSRACDISLASSTRKNSLDLPPCASF